MFQQYFFQVSLEISEEIVALFYAYFSVKTKTIDFIQTKATAKLFVYPRDAVFEQESFHYLAVICLLYMRISYEIKNSNDSRIFNF